jgi:hypothetical protein
MCVGCYWLTCVDSPKVRVKLIEEIDLGIHLLGGNGLKLGR